MKLENPLPGEEEELQKKLRKAQRKYRQIPPEEEEKIAKQVHNKIERREKVRKTFRRILAALGLSMAIGGSAATIATISDHNKQIEQEEETNSAKKRQEFAQQYQQEIEDVDEERNYSREINRIKTEEELLNYLKELYIEERKEIMGDTLLKPDNITITYTYEDRLLKDIETGKLITHGDFPNVTKENLKNNYGIETTGYGKDIQIYQVCTEGRIIDCITRQNVDGEDKSVKVYDGNNYTNYTSILAAMENVIPAGLSYKDRFGDEGEKQHFIKAVEEWQENSKETNIENQKQEEGPEL